MFYVLFLMFFALHISCNTILFYIQTLLQQFAILKIFSLSGNIFQITFWGNHSYWKKLDVKSEKSSIQKSLALNICNEAKQVYPKNKKVSRKRYSMSFRSNHPKVFCKKSVLKIFFTLFICILLKQTSGSRQQPVKILISKKFYFD